MPHPFHVSVHDTLHTLGWGYGDPAHSTTNNPHRDRTPVYIRLVLNAGSHKENIDGKGIRRIMYFDLSGPGTAPAGLAHGVWETVINLVVPVINNYIFNHNIYQLDTAIPISATNVTLIRADVLPVPVHAVSVAGRRKTKRKITKKNKKTVRKNGKMRKKTIKIAREKLKKKSTKKW